MAQEVLDEADVRTALKQVGGERVAPLHSVTLGNDSVEEVITTRCVLPPRRQFAGKAGRADLEARAGYF